MCLTLEYVKDPRELPRQECQRMCPSALMQAISKGVGRLAYLRDIAAAIDLRHSELVLLTEKGAPDEFFEQLEGNLLDLAANTLFARLSLPPC
eukprot:3677619-Pyramimonas_sp.AAC.1